VRVAGDVYAVFEHVEPRNDRLPLGSTSRCLTTDSLLRAWSYKRNTPDPPTPLTELIGRDEAVTEVGSRVLNGRLVTSNAVLGV
jgi:hypothetical protein